MAPADGLEPPNAESESAVLPIRLSGNMAGGERIELPSSESKSDELTVIQNPQY